jgi:hypothetical protein
MLKLIIGLTIGILGTAMFVEFKVLPSYYLLDEIDTHEWCIPLDKIGELK